MSDKIETRREMRRAGAHLMGPGKCKGCGQLVDWWRMVSGESFPFDPSLEEDGAVMSAHWKTCPNRGSYLSKRDRADATKQDRAQQVRELLDRTGARAVVAVYPEGPQLAWASGISYEALHDELMAAAKKMLWQMRLGKETQA